MVEVAKALHGDARLLIMDEPTSALTASEIDALFAAIERLTAQGVAVVYISHRLEEVDASARASACCATAGTWRRTRWARSRSAS